MRERNTQQHDKHIGGQSQQRRRLLCHQLLFLQEDAVDIDCFCVSSTNGRGVGAAVESHIISVCEWDTCNIFAYNITSSC